jgi:hypothetical protein
MKHKLNRYLLELSALFVLLSVVIFFSGKIPLNLELSQSVLWSGNSILFILSAIALLMHSKGASSNNPNAFFRSVYGSMIIRMMGVLFAVLIYASVAGSKVNQPAVLTCIAFYFIYTFYEIRIVFRMLKKSGNAKERSSGSDT